MPGKVIKVNVNEGDKVNKGDTLIIVEAMKMENHLSAPMDAVVTKINVNKDDKVDANSLLIELSIAE
jgi:biotin carboxyl carrier protein